MFADNHYVINKNNSYAITLFCKDGKFKHIFFEVVIRKKTTSSQNGNISFNSFECRKVDALIDTGSTISGITSRMVKDMKLTPEGDEHFTHAQGSGFSPVYSVDVVFPRDYVFEDIKVAEISDDHINDFLIGMNILTLGDVALSSENGESAFSFRVPSAGKFIDFEKE